MERRIRIGWIVFALCLLSQPAIATAQANTSLQLSALRYGVFEQPLIAFTSVTPPQRKKLAAAISSYSRAGDPAQIESLKGYLHRTPNSPWRASLLVNMALARERAGYFSEAIELLEQALAASRGAATVEQKGIRASALGELLNLHTRFGHKHELARLLALMDDAPKSGSISENVAAAKSGLWQMRHAPQDALRCGIFALEALASAVPGSARMDMLQTTKAGPEGMTLAQLAELAHRANIPARAILRRPGQPIPVPSVVHWRVGHYATIVDEKQGRYRIKDPAYGRTLWMTRAAVEAESSGYFLVPANTAKTGPWHRLALAEVTHVIGGGYPSSSDLRDTSNDSPTECDNRCANHQPAGKQLCGKAKTGCPVVGMPQYRVHSMLVSLNINDTPVSYTPPVGPDVALTLTYSQREAFQPANFTYFNLGQKWTLNWLSYVEDDPQSPGYQVSVYLPGGGTRTYNGFDGQTGNFTPEQRTGAVLVRVASSPVMYERRMPDGSKYVYSESDLSTYFPRRVFLTKMVDPAGNAVSLQYDAQQRLTSLTDAIGQVTNFTYGDASDPLRLTRITDPFGRSAAISYDANGRLQGITDAIGMTSTFAYDAGTFINAMTTPYGTTSFSFGEDGTTRWLEITDPKGERERVEYRNGAPTIPYSDSPVPSGMNLFNAYINGRNTYYWDKEAMKRAPGDYTQARIRHWYHLRTNTSVTAGVLESEKTPLENRIWYNYPGQGWGGADGTLDKPSIVGRVLPDGSTQLTHRSYNALGNVTSITDPEGRELDLEYASNQIDVVRIKRKSASGYDVLAEFTYNAQHRPLTYTGPAGQLTTFSYNNRGQLISRTNPLGQTTRYEYDNNAYLTAVIDPSGTTRARYTYDTVGRVASKTDAAGYTLLYTYDALDRLNRTTFPDGTHEDVYWSNLDVGAEVDRYGNLIQYAYDAVRNLLVAGDAAGHTTRYSYFANGLMASVTDGNGNITQLLRDIQGRVTSTTRADGSQSTRSYDSSGRLTRTTNALGGNTDYGYTHDDRVATITDPNGNVTAYTYDPYSGDPIEQRSPDTGVATYQYDPAGNVISRTDANGQTTAYTYDLLNRVIHAAYADGQTVDYQYDTGANRVSRLVSISEASGTTHFAYDARGNIQMREQTSPDGTVLRVTYDYNSENLLRSVTYPSQKNVEYRYTHGRLTSLLVNGVVILDGVTYEPHVPFGQITGWTWANGQSSHRSYDANGQMTAYSVGVDSRTLRYDTVNNLNSVTGGGVDQEYAYDRLARLTAAQSWTFNPRYTYDANGNRTLMTEGNTTIPYALAANSNRLTTVGGAAYTYDANGNVLADGRHQYGYSARNRLIRVDADDTATYAYNALGQRVYKNAVTVPTQIGANKKISRYVYDGARLLGEYLGYGAPVQEIVWLGDTPVAVLQGNQVYYVHTDSLGAPRALTDAQARVVWRWDPRPFGDSAPNEDPDGDGLKVVLNLRFPGQYYDQETGLHYNYYRYYDPSTGRYISSDPIGLAGGLNTYTYIKSNPLLGIDPLGLFDISGNHIDIGDIQGYSFRLNFYYTWLKQFGRDYGRSGIKTLDRIAKLLGMLSSRVGVSDLPKSKREACDTFDLKAKSIFEDMFGSENASVNSDQLLQFLRRLEQTPGYPRNSYPPAQEFVRRAEERAHMSPKDMIRGLAN